MTQEQIKAKAKEYFPNDEFKQQIVIDAINWATKELQKENTELKAECDLAIEGRDVKIMELEAQIEKMKNCFNCAKGDWENRVKCIKSGCVNKNKWEIKEND